jgi:hypothetical protein
VQRPEPLFVRRQTGIRLSGLQIGAPDRPETSRFPAGAAGRFEAVDFPPPVYGWPQFSLTKQRQ